MTPNNNWIGIGLADTNRSGRGRAIVACTAFALAFAATAILLPAHPAQAATCTAKTNKTSWMDPGTWNGCSVPLSTDDVVIPSGATINMDLLNATALSLDVQSGGTLNFLASGFSLSVGKNVTVAGTLALGTVAGGDLSLGGNWTNNGTFTANGRTVTFNGSSGSPQLVSGASSTSFANLTVNNGGNGVRLGQDITVNNTVNLVEGDIDAATNSKVVTLGSSATWASSVFDIVGTARRNSPGTGPKTYNGFRTIIDFVSGAPTRLDVTLAKSQGFSGSIARTYTLDTGSDVTGNANLSFHYQDPTDTNATSVAGALYFWSKDVDGYWYSMGRTSDVPSGNDSYATLNGITPSTAAPAGRRLAPDVPWWKREWTLAGDTQGFPTAVTLESFGATSVLQFLPWAWAGAFGLLVAGGAAGWVVWRRRRA